MPAVRAGLICAGLCAAAALCRAPAAAQVVSKDQQEFLRLLNVVSDKPNDKRAREALIRLVDRMEPKPKVPMEAKKYFVKAVSIHMDAVKDTDFDAAAVYYERALQAAPWWGQCYYNLASALESGKRFREADELMAFYRRVHNGAAGGERPALPEAQAAAPAQGAPDFSGVWGSGLDCWRYEFVVKGSRFTIMMRCWDFEGVAYGSGVLKGRDFSGSSPGGPSGTGMGTHSPIRFKGSISEDGSEIKIYSILAPDLAGSDATLKAAREQVRLYGEPEWQSQTWQRMSGGD